MRPHRDAAFQDLLQLFEWEREGAVAPFVDLEVEKKDEVLP